MGLRNHIWAQAAPHGLEEPHPGTLQTPPFSRKAPAFLLLECNHLHVLCITLRHCSSAVPGVGLVPPLALVAPARPPLATLASP
jgi:hypothetical protein